MTGKTTGCVLDVARQRGGAEPSVVTLHDHSRFGNDGAMTAITWTQLPSGLWVMSFNGTTSISNHGAAESMHFRANDFTILFWFNVPGFGIFSGRYIGANDRVYFGIAGAGDVRMYGRVGGVNNFDIKGSTNVSDETWHHAAVLGDRGNRGWVFIDGVDDTAGDRLCLVNDENINANFTIGYYTLFGTGILTLIRIYRYLMTPAQIRSHYSAERRLFGA